MGAKGSLRTFENLLGVWVRTAVQLPPSGCMRDGSTLMPSPDTRRHGPRQGCTADRPRARLETPVSQVTMGRYIYGPARAVKGLASGPTRFGTEAVIYPASG